MRLLLLVLAVLLSVTALPTLRFKRQQFVTYYRNPSFSTREGQQWRYGGYGNNNGEGSTWEGTHPERISNNDWSFFGRK